MGLTRAIPAEAMAATRSKGDSRHLILPRIATPESNSAWRATGNARAYHTAPIAYGRPGGVDDRVRGLIQ